MNSKNSRVGIPATRTVRLAALLAAVLLAVHATAARGDITFLKSWGSYGTADGQLFWPGGIGVSPSGDVYVADSYNDRIQKFTANGAFIKKFGTSGTGDGQFDSPRSVAFGPGGELYVADTWNDRIQKFTADEVFVMKFGAHGYRRRPVRPTLWCRGESPTARFMSLTPSTIASRSSPPTTRL